jgi:PAS domain S-box-containing protein
MRCLRPFIRFEIITMSWQIWWLLEITQSRVENVAFIPTSMSRRELTKNDLRVFLDTIPSMMWCSHPDGSIECHNQRWLEYTGLSLHQTKGWGWMASIHPQDSPGLLERWRYILETGEPGEMEGRMRRFDGQYRWFLFRAAPMRDALGNIINWYGATTDIEDRKYKEDALRRSEAYLAEAERLSHTGSWAYDIASGVPVYWSSERCRISNFDPVKGHPTLEDYRALHPEDDWEKLMETYARAIREKKDFETDTREVLADGTVKLLHIVGHPVLNAAGNVVELVGSTMDMTERKRTEEALHKAQAHLSHVTHLTRMGELAASIAHEINQPLAAMVANANACLRWLDRESPNFDEALEAIRRIIRDGNRGSDVIARIRALLKKEPPSTSRLNLNDVFREMITLTRPNMQGVSLRTQLADDLPYISGDRVQLHQVLLNLLSNAMDAMKSVSDRPRVLRIQTQRHAGRAVLSTVEDSGIGLDPEHIEQLFEPFYTTKAHGFGMGLSISRSIIEAHGGRLWAEPNRSAGATFRFTLPAEDSGAT